MASRAEWTSRVKRWQASGLTAGEFAEREGVNERSLAWWRWNLKRGPAPSPTAPASAFLPVRVIEAQPMPTPAPVTDGFEVALQNGCVVRVPVKFDPVALERILAIVARRSP